MQATEFLNYRLKFCCAKVIYCICQPNELKREFKKKTESPNRGSTKNLMGPWPTQAALDSPLPSPRSPPHQALADTPVKVLRDMLYVYLNKDRGCVILREINFLLKIC